MSSIVIRLRASAASVTGRRPTPTATATEAAGPHRVRLQAIESTAGTGPIGARPAFLDHAALVIP